MNRITRVLVACIIALVGPTIAAFASVDLNQRRDAAYDQVVLARSEYITAEIVLNRIYSFKDHQPTDAEFDEYTSHVSQCLTHALEAYYLVGPGQVLPPCNCDVRDALQKIPDESFGENIFPDSLPVLVKAGIIPDMPWDPERFYSHNLDRRTIPEKFSPFTIVYRPVLSKHGYLREKPGLPEGAVLICFGASEQSRPGPRNGKVDWVLFDLGLSQLPNGAVGYFAQIADEIPK